MSEQTFSRRSYFDEFLLALVRAMALITGLGLLRAWVLDHFWAWYIYPLTHVAAPALGYTFGTLLALSVLLPIRRPTREVELWDVVGFNVTTILIVWAIGWLGTFFL